MLILRATADVLRVITGSAGAIDCHVSAMECDNAAPPVIQDVVRTNTASITTATTTTILDCTTANRRRNVGFASVFNTHASVSNTITIEHFDGTTAESLWQGTLLPGEYVEFGEGGAWLYYGVDGALKPSAAKLNVKKHVTADQAFATAATFADVTDLSGIAVKNGKKYAFLAGIFTTNNASTTGSQFGVNGPTMSSVQIGEIGAVTNSATAGVLGIGTAAALNTAAVVQTTGQTAVGLHYITGGFEPSADGTFAFRCTSEVTVANGCVVKRGSWLRLWEAD